MKKILFSLSFVLLWTNMAFAQLTLPLANGQKFTIAGGSKETYKDNYNKVFYLKETADSIYFYQYDEKNFFLEETRFSLRFFNQTNTKANGANVKFYHAKRFANSFHKKFANSFHFVSFKCAKDGKDMLKGFKNDFILTKYGTNNIEKSTTCLANIKFKDKEEAKEFLKRINERIKQLN